MSRRAYQLGLARRALEGLAGEHAAELAQKATEVAYLSSMVGLTGNLLSAKQRWERPLHGPHQCRTRLPKGAARLQPALRREVLHASDMGAAGKGWGEADDLRPPAADLFRHHKVSQCAKWVAREALWQQGPLLRLSR